MSAREVVRSRAVPTWTAFFGFLTGYFEALSAFPEAFAADTQLLSEFCLGELFLVGGYETHEVVFQRCLVGSSRLCFRPAASTRVL